MIESLVRRLLLSRGYYLYAPDMLPIGVNWMLDAERLMKPTTIDTIFDVGANIGQTAALLNKRFNRAKIYSFEPVSATFQKLLQSSAALMNVTCENCALGSQVAAIDIHLKKSSEQNSLLQELNKPTPGGSTERIQVRTVDDYLHSKTMKRLHLLKTDTEGFDLEVLSGAQSALRETRIDLIVAEVGFHPDRRHHTYLSDVQDYLQSYGYELYCIYDQNHYAGRIDYADAMFVSPRVRQDCGEVYAKTFIRHAQ
jgi:FkbM family methyltransferase